MGGGDDGVDREHGAVTGLTAPLRHGPHPADLQPMEQSALLLTFISDLNLSLLFIFNMMSDIIS